jgi:hypothetical protein
MFSAVFFFQMVCLHVINQAFYQRKRRTCEADHGLAVESSAWLLSLDGPENILV